MSSSSSAPRSRVSSPSSAGVPSPPSSYRAPLHPLNPRHVMQNNKALNFARTSLSVLSGGVAGILGLTALYGFLFYFVVSGFLGVYYLFREARSDAVHFLNKQQLVTAFIFENLFTYILVWTLVYGCVHVY